MRARFYMELGGAHVAVHPCGFQKFYAVCGGEVAFYIPVDGDDARFDIGFDLSGRPDDDLARSLDGSLELAVDLEAFLKRKPAPERNVLAEDCVDIGILHAGSGA